MAKSTVCCGLLLFKSRSLPDAESLRATEHRQLLVYNRQESKVSRNNQGQSLPLNPFPCLEGAPWGLTTVWERSEGVQQKEEILLSGEKKKKKCKRRVKEVSAAHSGNQLVRNVFSMSEPERSSTPHRFLNNDAKIQPCYKMSDKFRISQFHSSTRDSH